MRVKVCGADNFNERWAVFKELDAAKAKGMTVLYEPSPETLGSKLRDLVREWAKERGMSTDTKGLVVGKGDFDLILVFDGTWLRNTLAEIPSHIIREVC